ncbi:MAG: hypothetical protein GC131_02345 [Alphaproteobacteria bacterium]|nr:hypothetical protein [Alphaproteobacteria bacterium]
MRDAMKPATGHNALPRSLAALLACALVFAPAAARADCDTPTGVAGQQFYNTSYNIMQYCNGSNWINMGTGGVSGFGALASGKWCTSDGTVVTCTEDEPTGTMVGPGSSTDNAIARWDGTTGTTVQDSAVIIDDSGNVGIGTTTASYALDIPTATSVARIGRVLAGGWPSNTTYAVFGHAALDQSASGNYALLQSSAGITYLNASSGNAIYFRIDNASIMTMNTNGLGVGVTPSASYKIYTNGNILSTGYYHSSDARLKHDVTGFERDPIETVKGLRAVHFKWNDGGKQDFGVIAQEVEKVLPEAITRDEKGFMAVQYDKLVLPVIEAVKQMAARMSGYDEQLAAMTEIMRKQAAKLAVMEERLAALEAANEKLRAAQAAGGLHKAGFRKAAAP